MSGYPVIPPSEKDALLVPDYIADLSTTRQKLAFPSGAKWLAVSYRLLPGATAVANQYAKMVINAASDADADGKLAFAGAFVPIMQGDDVVMAAEAVTRLDVVASAAVGAEKTIFRVLAGV